MGWKGSIIEVPVWLGSKIAPTLEHVPAEPDSIFVLRNNDIGDLLVTTPLFQALRERFPNSRIVAGVGNWNTEVLQHNPYIDEVLAVNAPWNNKFTAPQRTRDVVRYIWFSKEARQIADKRFDIGIDVLGSHVGSALMMRAGIPYRLGVKGYRGGHSAARKHVTYNDAEHVGRSALRFAELLGATKLPTSRPQIFLSGEEREIGQRRWLQSVQGAGKPVRIVVGPGGGFPEKCWPSPCYAELMECLTQCPGVKIIVVGGKQDRETGSMLAGAARAARSLAGELTLRETFALVAASDLVICNPSMLLHVAAAFRKMSFVLLGEYFPSAAQHQVQWGYPETCWTLGKDHGHPDIFQAQEAFDFIIRTGVLGGLLCSDGA